MDSQGTPSHSQGTHASDASAGHPPAMGSKFRSQGSSIPPAPFFGGFPHPGVQMPFLFPQSFMPPLPGMGFPLASHGSPNAPVDLTPGSPKPDLSEFVVDQLKSTKKRRVGRKNPEIIQLDNVNDEVDVVKSGGHWKDHWVIQLIAIRGEMHSSFSLPPKQGEVANTLFKTLWLSCLECALKLTSVCPATLHSDIDSR